MLTQNIGSGRKSRGDPAIMNDHGSRREVADSLGFWICEHGDEPKEVSPRKKIGRADEIATKSSGEGERGAVCHSHSDTGEANGKPKPAGEPVTTANGRVLYGGRGIEPDVVVKPVENNVLRFRVNEAAFFFVRQLVAGKVPGLESYKIEKQEDQRDDGIIDTVF